MTTLGTISFGEIDQEYDKYYGAITTDIRGNIMIELYNEDNIKVYVDDDERYILGDVSNPRYLKITTHQNDSNYLYILLDKPSVANCTITIKGNTVIINGTSNSSKAALQVDVSNYSVTLKGNFAMRVYNGDEVPSVYTLYDETYVYQITDTQRIKAKVDFILYNKATLHTDGFESYITAYLYDSSFCWLYKGKAKIYAYDHSRVAASSLVTKLEADAYDNAKVEAREGADVVINDESKLVRF